MDGIDTTASAPRSRALAWAVAVAAGFADLVAAHHCAGCQAESVVLCPACAVHLARPPRAVSPVPAPVGLPAVFAVADYSGPVPGMLHAHKEEAIRPLAAPLGAAVARSALALLDQGGVPLPSAAPVLVVPVPSSPRALRRRGHDAVGRMARVAARRLRGAGRAAVYLPALVHHRRVADQAGLNAAERALNLVDAFRVRAAHRPLVAAGRVVVVDDLVTTGASLVEASRALRAEGADVVGAATVAAVPRRQPVGAAAVADPHRRTAGRGWEVIRSGDL